MKKFKKTITVSIQLDTIAQQLLNMMKDDATYREIVAEYITGIMDNERRVGDLYAALNGTVPSLLPIGTIVYVRADTYVLDEETAKYKNVYLAIQGEIKTVDPYDKSCYGIDYEVLSSAGEKRTRSTRFDAYSLAMTAEEVVL